MTYPGPPETPDDHWGIDDVTDLQDVNPPGGGTLRGPAEAVRMALVNGLLGGFTSIGQMLASFGNDILTALLGGVVGEGGFLAGIRDWAQGLLGRVEDAESIINDHSQSITEVTAALDRVIMQGDSKVYTSDNVHYISEGVTQIDIIVIGAGGGGAGGKWNLIYQQIYPGAGGGGGGEVHTTIPRALIDGNSIEITVGRGGARGGNDGNAGGGGGNSAFGPIVAGGGQGGRGGSSARSSEALGGTGMIPGGRGGRGGYPQSSQSGGAGGNSVSQYELYGGGGGGGGGGGVSVSAGNGGAGGISPGGTPNSPGATPAGIVATGAGGGGGGGEATLAGDGAFPAGGGGGGYADQFRANSGGQGGHGVVFVIERIA